MNTIIEKIRAEIERRKKRYQKDESGYGDGAFCEDVAILSFLSDLEKSEKPTTAEGLEEEIERYQEEHFEYNSEFDSIRLKGDYLPSPQTLADIARHFAQWQKEQMMKGAVEVIVQPSPLNGPLGISAYCCNFPSKHPFYHCKEGDKVRIIIVKED